MLARRARCMAQQQNGNGFGLTTGQAAQAWAAPRVSDANGVGLHGDGGMDLKTMAAHWATPNVPNGGRKPAQPMSATGMTEDGTKRQVGLENQVGWWERGMTPPQSAALTEPSDSSPAKPPRRGLNHRFGLWLMGYPVGWLDSAPSATRPSRSASLKARSP